MLLEALGLYYLRYILKGDWKWLKKLKRQNQNLRSKKDFTPCEVSNKGISQGDNLLLFLVGDNMSSGNSICAKCDHYWSAGDQNQCPKCGSIDVLADYEREDDLDHEELKGEEE